MRTRCSAISLNGVAMGYKRQLLPDVPQNLDLENRLAGLGMALACEPTRDANIEDVLLEGVRAGMVDGNLRVLGLITSWLDHYHAWINADRLIRCLRTESSARVQAYWVSRAQAWATDIRWKRLRQQSCIPVDLLPVGTAFQVTRKGEDPRFVGTVVRVPQGTLRERTGDVEPAHHIACHHRSFRWRLLVGPSYRADCLAVVEAEPTITASALARRTYASFATAWGVLRDLRLLNPSATL